MTLKCQQFKLTPPTNLNYYSSLIVFISISLFAFTSKKLKVELRKWVQFIFDLGWDLAINDWTFKAKLI